jgi:anthranilate 1,2-dioxygenase small subunit
MSPPEAIGHAFLAIWALQAAYADTLDRKDFDGWPALFTDDGRYTILSAENVARGHALPILDYTHPPMMRDRMVALREAAVFTQATERRLFGNLRVSPVNDGLYRASSNVAIYRTDNIEGTTSLFVTGRYEDEIRLDATSVLFRSRTVHVDTFSIPNHIGFPL